MSHEMRTGEKLPTRATEACVVDNCSLTTLLQLGHDG